MAGKRYSAGAIFLQVVPVFANVQRAIEDEAKNIDRSLGDQMEKSGERAGHRAGKAASKAMADEVKKADIGKDLERQILESVDGIDKALGKINTKNLGKKLRGEVKEMRAELASLSDVDIKLDDNLDSVRARLATVKAQIEDMRKRSKVFFDIKGLPQVYRDVAKLQGAIDAIDGNIKVDVDTRAADRAMGAFEKRFKQTANKAAKHLSSSMNPELAKLKAELDYLSNLRIGVDISSGRAMAELGEIQAAIEALESQDLDIDARVDSAAAKSELATLAAFVKALDGKDIDVKVKVDSNDLSKAKHDADDAANSFRSFNGILLAAVSIGPALIPILAGIAGGLIALGPAAAVGAAGLSSVLIGFSGIGDAYTALGNQQDQAAKTAQSSANRQVSAARAIENAQESLSDARRNAARAAEDAADRVKEARESAADAIEEALKRQKDAQDEYRDAVQDVKDAEQDLRDAREEARKDAETLAKRQRQNAVDERQAVLDLGQAQNDYNAIMADGSSTDTDKEQAAVNLEQAQLALNDTRDEQVALADEAADYAKNGVDGSDKVKNAQDDVTAALEAQKDAQDAVKDAAEAADKARIDGAKAVQDALEDQRDTLSDNARAIQRAKEAVADARQSAVDDLAQIDSQAQAVEAAFDKLGPAGRKFALFLFSLRSGFYEFRDAIQTAMLPAVQQAIEAFTSSPAATKLKDALVALAGGFGDFVKALSRSFRGKVWTDFFEMLGRIGPKIQKAYGKAFISFLEAFASILTITAPFALRFAEGLADMMDSFAKWAESKQGAKDIREFLSYVKEVGPRVIAFFEGLVGAAINVIKALAPFGEVVLGLVDGFLAIIANMDTDVLGALLTGLTVILLASQVAYAVMNLSMSLGALFATTLGPWVFLIIAVAAALVYLYETNEDFANFVDKAWTLIKEVFTEAWEKHIKPALMNLWDAINMLWKEVLEPFFAWFGPILLWIIENILPVLLRVFAEKINMIAWYIENVFVPAAKAMGHIFQWVWNNVLKPTWDAISTAAKWLYNNVLKPVFTEMGEQWDLVLGDMKWVWNNVLKPVFDFITDTALPAFKTAFETTISAIGDLWDGLRELVANPIKFVIEKVINGGLIAGFNMVSGWVNGPHLDDVPVPDALQFASGGIMPGYTPGRDVHAFVSPTAGRLDLSGGEAIMRPEWTAAMGPAYVDQMNAAARRGGVGGVRKAMGMGGYWMGGILPLPGASVASHGASYPFPAFDMNVGSGYDDYGMAVKAFKAGIASLQYLGDASYGRYVTLDHGDQTTLYAHLSAYAKDLVNGMRVAAGQTIGYVGDLGNTGTPPTSHLHFEIRGAAPNIFDHDMGPDAAGEKHRSIPGWLLSTVKDPLGAFNGWITDPIKNAANSFADTPLFKTVSKTPAMLGKKVVDKVWDIIPGWVKTTAGWAGDAADWAVGGVKNAGSQAIDAAGSVIGSAVNGADAVADFFGFKQGGILPYNGAMMYDNGGYLQPGLTTVMNLTGKPEPVFTADQFSTLGTEGGENFTYAPTIQGSDLTAADLVDDLDFTRRKMKRQGRYERNQTS